MDINNLLKRSAELDESLGFLLSLDPYNDSKRLEASKVMCGVAAEHAQSLKILLGARNYTSATSLARLQYETYVRAMCTTTRERYPVTYIKAENKCKAL